MKYKAINGVILILLLMSISTSAFNVKLAKSESSTIIVPDDYEKMQWAIGNASNGDTILVRAGTYWENIDFLGKAIIVKSKEGPEETSIRAGYSGSVVIFDSGEDQGSIISGFTISNGVARFGGGIFCNNSSPTITNNIITNNLATISSIGQCGGGGIFCSNSNVVIHNNTIRYNHVKNYYKHNEPPPIPCRDDSMGGGILCLTPSPQLLYTHPTISGNVIDHNSVEGDYAYGGGSQKDMAAMATSTIVERQSSTT